MRAIPDPGFAGDGGGVDPAVAACLAAYDEAPDDRYLDTLAVLQDARVLVPVVAMLGEAEVDDAGLVRDKTSDMATVLMRGRDGRTALLAFTGSAALARWDPAARPVPVTLDRAAQAGVQDGAEALLVDVAGPVMYVVESEELASLARGHRLVRVDDGWGWAQVFVD